MSTKLPPAEKHSKKTRAVPNAEIVERLRLEIVGGRFLPGERLPSRVEIEEHFGTTRTTVQRAFDVLASDGFVKSRGRHGTFVAQHPPHLSRYALVFPGRPGPHRPFWESIADEIIKMEHAHHCRIVPFYEVEPMGHSPNTVDLLHQIKNHQLAGIIFAMHPDQLNQTQFLKHSQVPMTAIMTGPCDGVPVVVVDYESFFERALDKLKECGRRSIGGLEFSDGRDNYWETSFKRCRARGFYTERCWWIPCNISDPAAARVYTHLLMRSGQNTRPDALVIADDTLVEPALRGLDDAGLRAGEDVELIAFCNFPASAPPRAPMQRLGYCVPQVVEACLHVIEQQRAGLTPPAVTNIKAVWECEAEKPVTPVMEDI